MAIRFCKHRISDVLCRRSHRFSTHCSATTSRLTLADEPPRREVELGDMESSAGV